MNNNLHRVIKRNKAFEIILVVLLTILAASLRIKNINQTGLWTDELFTAYYSFPDRTIEQVIKGALSTPLPSPPLIYLVAHTWMKLFGFQDALLRIPFVFISALGIPAVYIVGKTLFNRTIGSLSAILLIFSPFHLFYSRQARYYSFIVIFSLMTIYFLHKALNANQRRWWVGYIIFSLLNIYTFLTTFFVLAAQGLYVAGLTIFQYIKGKGNTIDQSTKNSFSSYLISLAIIFFLYIPLLPRMIPGIQGPRGIKPDFSYKKHMFTLDFFINDLFATLGGETGLAFYIFLGFAFIGIVFNIKKYSSELILFGLISILPFLIIPLLGSKHWFNIRYVIFILPLFLIVVSLGISKVSEFFTTMVSINKQNSYQYIKSIILPLILLFTLQINNSNFQKGYAGKPQVWREQMMFINETMESNDITITYAKSPFKTIHPKKIMQLYFAPIISNQTKIFKVDNIKNLNVYFEDYDHVYFHYIGSVLMKPKIKSILSWLMNTPHLKLRFNQSVIIYMGKNVSEIELTNNIGKYSSHIVP